MPMFRIRLSDVTVFAVPTCWPKSCDTGIEKVGCLAALARLDIPRWEAKRCESSHVSTSWRRRRYINALPPWYPQSVKRSLKLSSALGR
jgi:hypothetical protein